MAQIIWTQLALEDLQSIHDYIAHDSIFYAERFVGKLVERVDVLVANMEAGKIVPEFGDKKIREIKEGNYRIIYHIQSADIVGIVRVHHSARLLIPPIL